MTIQQSSSAEAQDAFAARCDPQHQPFGLVKRMLAALCQRKAASAAIQLERAGTLPGRPIAAITVSADVLATLAYAAAALRMPLFPIDPNLPEAAINDLLAQAGVELVVSDADRPGIGVVPSSEVADAAPGMPPPSRYLSGDVALLVATSGSSGSPKAVMLTAGNIRAAARASAARTPLRCGDRWLACLPLFHIGGFSILARCAFAGAEALLHQKFDPGRVLRELASERITHLSLVPAMLASLVEATSSAPPPALRHVLVGGAALLPSLAERAAALGWPIQPTYGLSEAASQVATLAKLPRPWRAGLVGHPLPEFEVALGSEGRLKVRGPMVMAGYANPAMDLGHGLDDGWFQSSDLVEITDDGELIVLGRSDDVIVSGGNKVHPRIVEDLLTRCPGVASAAVAGRKDRVWGEIVIAVFAGAAAPDEVVDWCRANISPALRPRAAIRVAALPLLANGKLDRLALRRITAGDEPQSATAREN